MLHFTACDVGQPAHSARKRDTTEGCQSSLAFSSPAHRATSAPTSSPLFSPKRSTAFAAPFATRRTKLAPNRFATPFRRSSSFPPISTKTTAGKSEKRREIRPHNDRLFYVSEPLPDARTFITRRHHFPLDCQVIPTN